MTKEKTTNIALTYAEIGQLESADEWWNRAMGSGDKSASLGYAEFLLEHEDYQSLEQFMNLLETTATATESLEVSGDDNNVAQDSVDALRGAQTPGEMAEFWSAHRDDRIFEHGGDAAKGHFAERARADANDGGARFFLMLAIDERDLRSALAYADAVKKLSPQEQNLNFNIGCLVRKQKTIFMRPQINFDSYVLPPDAKARDNYLPSFARFWSFAFDFYKETIFS